MKYYLNVFKQISNSFHKLKFFWAKNKFFYSSKNFPKQQYDLFFHPDYYFSKDIFHKKVDKKGRLLSI